MLASRLVREFAKLQKPFKKWSIVTGDQVIVNTGKEKGKVGQVLKVFRNSNKIMVDGINVRYQQTKFDPNDSDSGKQVGIISPIHHSNVNLLDPETGKGTRVRIGFLADGTKVRISKRSKQLIPKPNKDELTFEARHRERLDNVKNTLPNLTLLKTYMGEDFSAVKADFEKYILEKERVESLLIFDK